MKVDITVLKSLIKNSRFDRGKKNIFGDCPWCGHNEFGVSVADNHVFNCFRKKKCGEIGNIYKLLHKLERLDLLNQYKYIDKGKKLNTELLNDLEDEKLDINVPTIKLPIGFKRIYSDNYLENRGFSSFQKIVVGKTQLDSKLRNYLIFVIYENNEPKAYLGRYPLEKEEIEEINKQYQNKGIKKKLLRYNNSQSDFSKIIAGYDELVENETTTVIIVEGLLDKENVDKKLDLDNDNWLKCVATFKATVSEEQIVKLKIKGIESIILMYDPDVINIIKTNAIELMRHFTVKIALLEGKNSKGKDIDPGEATLQQIEKSLSKLYDPIVFFRKKVQVLTF